jgi:DNA-binding NarL/FixJ family response regulator
MDRCRILLVDDSPEFLASAAHFLSLEPRVVVVGQTHSGASAVDLAREVRPDVVLMDLGLSGLGSLEVARRLGELSPAPRVVLLTVYDLPEYEVIRQRGAADGVLAKSRFGSDLLPLLAQWCRPQAEPLPNVA